MGSRGQGSLTRHLIPLLDLRKIFKEQESALNIDPQKIK
jgi:hypothetical protein